jgi:hypothetical protein
MGIVANKQALQYLSLSAFSSGNIIRIGRQTSKALGTFNESNAISQIEAP